MIIYGEHSMMEAYESYCKRILGDFLGDVWVLNLTFYILRSGHWCMFSQN